jgi:adenylate cyclase
MFNTRGIAGHVFTSGKGAVSLDPYHDTNFNQEVDQTTGFVTRNILCAPLRTVQGEIIGVAELLNKREGHFNEEDLALLEAMIKQAAIIFESRRTAEIVERDRLEQLELLNIVSDMSAEIKLGPLLQKAVAAITKMLGAERSTLFLNDEKKNELYTEIGEGLGATQIRMPNHLGIAGTVFQTRQSVNIPHAYADLRFNPSFDKRTGFFTRSILCVPVLNKHGKTIGVTQVLNKMGEPFNSEDETRLKAFTSQIAIALENAKLFDDVQNMKNYNESVLESMSSGVITFNEEGKAITCNAAGQRIMNAQLNDVLQRTAADLFAGPNEWVTEKITKSGSTGKPDVVMDAEMTWNGAKVSANVTVLPLKSVNDKTLGSLVMIEDISNEKRMKSTMARYMDPSIAEKLLQTGAEILGGQSSHATVLFSDIRSFTTLTEELGPQGTVSLLNEYFTIMVDCIQSEGGMLDKFIGDAIMAIFGTPVAHADDEDRGVRAAVLMLQELQAYNRRRAVEGKKPIDMGIGINSDDIVSGNIGSPRRMDYTVIGDGVNLASRLESACKQYHARLLISESTFKKLRGTYRSREVDLVVVKGKTQPVGVYEVLDYHTDETFPNAMKVLNWFAEGVKCYRKTRWDDAIHAFKEALELNPEDFASQMYIERCEHLKQTHVPESWDGVWVMKSK